MKRQTLGFKLLSSTVLASSLVSAGAMAQSADTFELEEILVTATKRGAKSVQDVPIAIQALNGSDLKAAGATEFIDIAGKVPSLQFEDLGPGDKKYIIRGVNSSGASTVGVYYDEGILTASNAEDGGGRNADIRLYDLERVEVLKGPQGTLYGASSMSGTIRFVTNKPKGDLVEGYVSGELSTTKKGGTNYNINGMVNLPIVENKLAMRTVAWLEDQSGFIDATRIPSGALEDVNTNETYGLRTHLRMWATDELTLTASGTYQKTDSDGSSRYTPAGTMSFGDADNGFAPVAGGDLINTDLTQSLWKEDLYTLGLTGEYVGETGTLTATTNYYKRNIDFAFDSSPILFFFGVPIPGVTLQPQERSIWSSELRYASSLEGPFNFVVGGFYGEERQDFEVQVIATDDDGLPKSAFSERNEDDALIGSGDTFFGRVSDYSLTQKAVFGELTYDVSDQFQLLVGARYYDSTRNSSDRTTHPFAGFSDDFVRDAVAQETSENKTTFKFNASYRPTDDLLFYATAAQGFRVGGVNRPSISSEIQLLPSYNSDSLWNYELGMKSTLADGRVNFNASVYSLRWTDMQVLSRDATGAFTFLTNAGKAKVDGVEVELAAQLSSKFEMSLGMSYQSAKLTEDAPDLGDPDSRALDGQRMPNVPKFQGSASATYRTPVTDSFELVIRGDLSWRSSANTEFNPNNPLDVELDSYALMNVRVGVENEDWNVSLFAKNLFDTRAQIDAINGTQDPLAYVTVRPRTIGVSVTRNF